MNSDEILQDTQLDKETKSTGKTINFKYLEQSPLNWKDTGVIVEGAGQSEHFVSCSFVIISSKKTIILNSTHFLWIFVQN